MMPGYRSIKYVWKVPRPDNEERAQILIEAAFYTAMQTHLTASVILIRSDVPHPTTFQNGAYVKDNYHITISVKNPQQEEDGTHSTTHGYTKSKTDLEIVGVSPNGYINRDDKLDNKGHPIWPAGLAEEQVLHPI
ncbi:MAG: hypothetical protein Q9173_002462 [Seirophora scorigena]